MRIYYASDVHGSELCWRKFLNAAKYYRVDALIMGGDITGKAIVPIESDGGNARSTYAGRPVELSSDDELEAFEKTVRDAGMYPYRASREELAELEENDAKRQALFDRVLRAELERWVEIAKSKLDGSTDLFVMAGNDDPWFVDEVLDDAEVVTLCDERIVRVGDHEMISLSYANRTPWDSPRELDESELHERIAGMADMLRDVATSVFNLHVPPFGTTLDQAPVLDATLKPVTHLGQVETGPVGSHSVRDALMEYQPLLSLHGHIHESRASCTLGRTIAINPGSEYSTGRIHGVIVELRKGRVRSHQLVSG